MDLRLSDRGDMGSILVRALKAPSYWMCEKAGALRPAVEAYLRQEPMTPEQIATMRAYLRQWIERGDWLGDGIGELLKTVDGLTDREAIRSGSILPFNKGSTRYEALHPSAESHGRRGEPQGVGGMV